MISNIVLGISTVILLCVIAQRFSYKLGIPALILFMFVGMLFGSDGIFKIPFDDFRSAEMICTIALIFIMFDGGFNTNWKSAKKVVYKAVSLSTLGVLLTALITTLCCHYFLNLSYLESFLISAVLASTDAASVFSILKSNNLDLKEGTSSILELESGSNDPMAYLLTITAISIMKTGQLGNVFVTIAVQLLVGTITGIIFAKIAKWILSQKNLVVDGLDTIFIFAITMLCYALTDKLSGNAYLSVYLLGIYLGNSRIINKVKIVSFFNEITSLLQILIFFIIGLLSFPKSMNNSILSSVIIMLILTFVSRPLMVMLLLLPQRCSLRQCLLISWAGLRGASSIVFAIMAVSSGISLKIDLFHIVFLVSLLSITIQGWFLPHVSRALNMIDEMPNVFKTFNDYDDESDFNFVNTTIEEGNKWIGKKVRDIEIPFGSQIMMIKRNGKTLAVKGDTIIKEKDELVFNMESYHPGKKERLLELRMHKGNPWINLKIEDISIHDNELIIKIFRDDETIIPDGSTVILQDDVLVIFRGEE